MYRGNCCPGHSLIQIMILFISTACVTCQHNRSLGAFHGIFNFLRACPTSSGPGWWWWWWILPVQIPVTITYWWLLTYMLDWVHTKDGLKVHNLGKFVVVSCSPKKLVNLGGQRGDSESLLPGLWAPTQVLGCLSQSALHSSGWPEPGMHWTNFLFSSASWWDAWGVFWKGLACFVEQQEDFECERRLKVVGWRSPIW